MIYENLSLLLSQNKQTNKPTNKQKISVLNVYACVTGAGRSRDNLFLMQRLSKHKISGRKIFTVRLSTPFPYNKIRFLFKRDQKVLELADILFRHDYVHVVKNTGKYFGKYKIFKKNPISRIKPGKTISSDSLTNCLYFCCINVCK